MIINASLPGGAFMFVLFIPLWKNYFFCIQELHCYVETMNGINKLICLHKNVA